MATKGAAAARKPIVATAASSSSTGSAALHRVKFEVHGKVQRVFFRKHTTDEAKRLGIRGYVLNTKQGTVQGVAYGTAAQLAEFKHWLSTKGSPMCIIEKAVFTEEGPATQCKFAGFSVHKDKK